MATLADRPNSALIVIDMQNDVVAKAHNRSAVISAIRGLVDQARSHNVGVIWVQHHDEDLHRDTPGWQIVPELVPSPVEPVVFKSLRDSFEGTDLERRLADRQVGHLIVTGAQTDYCVRWTLHGALARGYDTTLIADAHTTDKQFGVGLPLGAEIIAHTNAVWQSQGVPGCATNVISSESVTF